MSDENDDKPEQDDPPGTSGFVERRSGKDRRRTDDRRGPLRWDPRNKERRSGLERRKHWPLPDDSED